MRLTQRAVFILATALAGLVLATTTLPAAASTSATTNTSLALTALIKVRANIAVGNHPVAVAANPGTDRIYVANEADDTLMVINGKNKGGSAGISSVSCARAGRCSAGGAYRDAAGRFRAFVVSEI
jgi:DNA-binding beta-propeller fold protein YncE